MNPTLAEEVGDMLCQAMVCINHKRLDEAEALVDRAAPHCPDVDDLLLFRTLISIRRGRAREQLDSLDGRDSDIAGESRALCLHQLREPHWEGCARALEHSDDPSIRRSMRRLLGRPALADVD